MRCARCDNYIPEGVGLETCPECGFNISANLREVAHERQSAPQSSETIDPKEKSAFKISSRIKAFLFLAILLILTAVMFFINGNSFGGHSYYISNLPPGNESMPANRSLNKEYSFYRVVIRYPQDMNSPIGSYEVFLKPSGATHYMTLRVNKSRGAQLPVRYRVISSGLTDSKGKIYAPVNYHLALSGDLFKKQKGLLKNKKKVLKDTTQMLDDVDFGSGTGEGQLYFGYKIPNPPEELYLAIVLEVYTLDRSKKEIVNEKIKLKRIKGDPKAWLMKK